MNTECKSKDVDWKIAVHEAGHLLVGVALGRRPLKISIDFEDGIRGCHWVSLQEDIRNEYNEYLELLAGPRAQVEICPESIPENRLPSFSSKIIHILPQRGAIPSHLYDDSGWGSDILPIYHRMMLPDAPADNMPRGVRISAVLEKAENRLLAFFKSSSIRDAVTRVATAICAQRLLDQKAIEQILNEVDLTMESTILSWG